MKVKWSKSWKSSIQTRKQRKYVYNAPNHIRHRLLNSNLSKELREKYSKRSIVIRKGDEVKILRGKFAGKTGKITNLNIKKNYVHIENQLIKKKDGTEVPIKFRPSNLVVLELFKDDDKRFKHIKGA